MVTGLTQVNIALEAFAAVLTAVLLTNCLSDRAYDKRQRIQFIGMLVSLLIILLADGFVWAADGIADARVFLYIADTVNYIAGYGVILFFNRYLSNFVDNRKGRMKAHIKAFDVGFLIFSLLVLVNLPTGIYFRIAADGTYRRGELSWLSQVFPASALLTNTCIIAISQRLQLRKRVLLGIYTLIPFVRIVMDYFNPAWTLTYMGTFLCIFIHLHTDIHTVGQETAPAEKQTTAGERCADALADTAAFSL